jgi:integrase
MATLYETRAKLKGRKAPPDDAVFLAELEAPAQGRRIIFDRHRDAPRGFGVKVTGGGKRVFVLRYFAEGRDRLMKIGEHPTWSLAAAREAATGHVHSIDAGGDPLQEKRTRRVAPTVKEIVERYTLAHLDRLQSADEAKRYFAKDIVPVIGDRKVQDIRRADVVELVEAKAITAPRAARVLLGHLKHFLAWCELREVIEVSPAHGIKPAAIDRRMKNNNRGRVLDDAEIRVFWQSAESCGMHGLSALALKLVLVTGQRPGEVASMLHDEIAAEVWTIPAARRGKTSDDHAVPLSGTALELITSAKAEVLRLSRRRGQKPTGLVFETRPGEAITVRALSRAVVRYRDQLGNRLHPTFGHWTPHDLRRTARTGMAAAGVLHEHAERVVGHAQGGMTDTYNRHRYDLEKRVALEAWERRLLAIVESRESVELNVIPIRRKGKAQ